MEEPYVDLMKAVATAPTDLEAMFWSALADPTCWAPYLEELIIVDLEGPGDEPDDT